MLASNQQYSGFHSYPRGRKFTGVLNEREIKMLFVLHCFLLTTGMPELYYQLILTKIFDDGVHLSVYLYTITPIII